MMKDGRPMTQKDIDNAMNGDTKPEGKMDMEEVARLESENYSPEEIYAKVKEHLRYNVKTYFHCQLNRPELYGRIEDSIVYYNYIGKESVGKIVSSTVDDAIKSTKEALNIREFDAASIEAIKQKIADHCQNCKVRAMGARGIIKTTEKLFTGSLSNFLSDYIRRVNGKNREQLVGSVLSCRGDEEVKDESNIHWDMVS